jgi:predicted dehydrogenase
VAGDRALARGIAEIAGPLMNGERLDLDRRSFLKAGAMLAGFARRPAAGPLRFGVVGINHSHINSLVDAMRRAGGTLVSVYAKEPDLLAGFTKRYAQARVARAEAEVLEDPSIQLVLSAAIPDERAALAVRAMEHGKDFLVDKPGCTTLAQLADIRRVQARTRRIYSIMYGRFENRATVRAGELVKAGAIGRVIHTTGLGPHRMSPETRPPWFFERAKYGGIICDLASHQGDHFVFFTGSTRVDIVSSQVGNLRHPEHPGLEDFGDAVLRGDRAAGYFRVDWFSPAGLTTFGDERLTILGTDGYIELRQTVDIAGRPGDGHLFLVDQKSARYVDCRDVPLAFGDQLAADVLNRTETAMPQAHCLLAMEIALKAEQQAQRVRFVSS